MARNDEYLQMILLVNILWAFWELKYISFWLYLWQLKEYHIGRFLDHFTTHKGKKLIFSFEQIFKLVLLLFLLLNNNFAGFFISVIFLTYLAEGVLFARAIFNKTAKKPVKTAKAVFLAGACFALGAVFTVWTATFIDVFQVSFIIAFDIFTPLIVSAVVLLLQPFFVALRNLKILKAKNHLEKIKKENKLKVVAITGSYGKTSTKEFLSTILSTKYKVLATSKHQNSEIGVANCILNDLRPECEIFIAEVGAYNKGKVREVCNMLKPKIGIVTGVNEQHLSLFKSMKNLLSAEGGGELAQILPQDGLLLLNGDNKHCLALYKRYEKNKKIYSISNKTINPDIFANEISVQKDTLSFVAIEKNGHMAHFDVKVLGKQNVQNLLAAILASRELGMTMEEISVACKNIKPEQAGILLKNGKHGLEIIDSSYSANPDGVMADLDYLSIFPQKKVVVMPCLIELGEKSAEIHEKIGKKIAQVCDLAIITSEERFVDIKRGFDSVIPAKAGIQILFCDKPEDIYSVITLFCKQGDAVLLEGRVPKELLNLLFEK